jgi:2-polyprenyl-6-methoxyphenol hydroxylase-like FAD-dependent oxidoreductase
MKVLIAGAGIGGLTTALSLHAVAIDAEVIETQPELRPAGGGINLQPHAVRELAELGLGDQLAVTGIETGEVVHFDRHGSRIWGYPAGRHAGYGWPQYSVHRADLELLLLAAVRDRLGPDSVHTGMTFESVTEDGGGVLVSARSAASGEVKLLRADALVGADGLHSKVRAQLHPEEQQPHWSGIMMWRGVTRGRPFLSGRTVAICGANSTAKLVVYPVSRQAELSGSALINWVAEVKVADTTRHPEADWHRAGETHDVLPWFADWTFSWLDVPGLIKSTEKIMERPMVDREPLDWWGRGRVTLLGDAAHPMYPVGSNSGSQAILDARLLANQMATIGSVPEALAAYEQERRETTNAIVLACRDMPADRLLDTVSARAPEGFDAITDVLTDAELAGFMDAYRSTSLQDAAVLNARPSLSGGMTA